jgi:hypothetical protein
MARFSGMGMMRGFGRTTSSSNVTQAAPKEVGKVADGGDLGTVCLPSPYPFSFTRSSA